MTSTKSPSKEPQVFSREELADLLMRLPDQRPLLRHMIVAIRAHEGAEEHRCHTSACAQVAEFKAVLLACEFRKTK